MITFRHSVLFFFQWKIPVTAGAALLTVLSWVAEAYADPDSDSKDSSGSQVTEVSQRSQTPIKQLIFEEQKIEGKIRRPQLVLIKADQRPEFNPMVLQSLGKTKNFAGLVDQDLIERSPYSGAFQFEGTKIINIAP